MAAAAERLTLLVDKHADYVRALDKVRPLARVTYFPPQRCTLAGDGGGTRVGSDSPLLWILPDTPCGSTRGLSGFRPTVVVWRRIFQRDSCVRFPSPLQAPHLTPHPTPPLPSLPLPASVCKFVRVRRIGLHAHERRLLGPLRHGSARPFAGMGRLTGDGRPLMWSAPLPPPKFVHVTRPLSTPPLPAGDGPAAHPSVAASLPARVRRLRRRRGARPAPAAHAVRAADPGAL